MTAPSRLEAILDAVRRRAAERLGRRSAAEMRAEVAADPERRRRFLAALRREGFAFIAECKRRSPSAGDLRAEPDLLPRARAYAEGGAAALSVLTEEDHFGGSPGDLARARAAGLPVLRKDFLLDELMVVESVRLGADAVLLIACVLPGGELRALRDIAGEMGLAVLVEVHDEEDLERAVAVVPEAIGVNSRDLRTFAVDPRVHERLLPRIPPAFVRVAESGLASVEDFRRVQSLGADAALVGEALMRAGDPAAALRGWRQALGGGDASWRLPRVKICGLRRPEDVSVALCAGADAVGFVLHDPSPRSLQPEEAAALSAALPPDVLRVAVLVDVRPRRALELARRAGAAAVQLCGREEPQAWRGFELPILRRLAVDGRAPAELEAWRGIAAAFVLDHPDGPGGTGREVDLAAAAALAAEAPCLLAGGLDASNVAAAVAAARPAGVDASSRLESAPGVKDAERVRAFVAAARRALAEVGR